MDPTWVLIAVKIALTLWMVVLSIWDHVHRRVPNWLVLPVMFGALIWQIILAITDGAGGIWFVLVAWTVLFCLWRVHIFGGGDAKFLMALMALFSSTSFLILFSLGVLVISLPLMVAQAVKSRSLPFGIGKKASLSLPTEEQLRSRGRPYCWTLALPGVVYLWWAW